MKTFRQFLLDEDGVAANMMGGSSSTAGSGGIDTFDPMLGTSGICRRLPPGFGMSTPTKKKKKKRLTDDFRK